MVIHGFFSVFVVECFASLIGGKQLINNLNNWSPEIWMEELTNLARYTFFIDNQLLNNEYSSSGTSLKIDKDFVTRQNVSLTNGILAFFMCLILMQRFIHGFFLDLCLFSCVITLWLKTKLFADSIIVIDPKQIHHRAIHIQESWNNVYSKFCEVKHISETINAAIGSQVTLFLVESIIDYSISLTGILNIKNPLRATDTVCFSMLVALILIFSANICTQVSLRIL